MVPQMSLEAGGTLFSQHQAKAVDIPGKTLYFKHCVAHRKESTSDVSITFFVPAEVQESSPVRKFDPFQRLRLLPISRDQ